jgi:hypothetical protein
MSRVFFSVPLAHGIRIGLSQNIDGRPRPPRQHFYRGSWAHRPVYALAGALGSLPIEVRVVLAIPLFALMALAAAVTL